jgi:chorismate mutase
MSLPIELSAIRTEIGRYTPLIIEAMAKRYAEPLNAPVYRGNGTDSILDKSLSTLEHYELATGQFQNGRGAPFFSLELKGRETIARNTSLHPVLVDVNPRLKEEYLSFLSHFFKPQDNGRFFATGNLDAEVLKLLSRRVHLGVYVAEAKYRESMDKYDPLIQANDREGMVTLLTNKAQEEKVLAAVREEASHRKVPPHLMHDLFEVVVIPSTIEAELDLLTWRLTSPDNFPLERKIR